MALNHPPTLENSVIFNSFNKEPDYDNLKLNIKVNNLSRKMVKM